jgi:uncharacterized protein (TIGR03437 family)
MKSAIVVLGFAATTLGVRLEPVRPTAGAGLWFEPNTGQVKGRTEFIGRTRGAYLYITGTEVVFEMAPAKVEPGAKMRQVRMSFVGAAAKPSSRLEQATGGYSNYFVGKTEKEWFTGVPHYERLRYRDVYPGIDVVYYGNEGRIEYDFEVKPGADVSKIGIQFSEPASLDATGDLVAGGIRQRKPRVMQSGAEIKSWYEIEDGVVKVRTAAFDQAVGLTIDPVLDFSTFLGGPGEDGLWAIAVGSDGNPVLAGGTQSPASPVLDPFQQPSVVSEAPIILKMSADGRRVIFYSILGRNGWDGAASGALEKDGSILVTGTTRSASFPTKNAFQTEYNAVWDNGFVAKLTSDGRSLVYSSYLGGTYVEQMTRVMVDRNGDGWFLGTTRSKDFPLKKPLQAQLGGTQDAVLVKLSASGEMLFSTFFGGYGQEFFSALIQLPDGSILMGGYASTADFPLKDPIQDFLTPRTGYFSSALVRIPEDASQVLYSTFLGGTASSEITDLALDSANNIWALGSVYDRGIATKDAFQSSYVEGTSNGFLMKLDQAARKVLYSSYLNGVWPRSILIDKADNIYIGGVCESPEFVLKDSLQGYLGGGILQSDHAVMKFASDARTLIFSTLIGGSGNELGVRLALAADNSIFGVGQTGSTDYPVKNAYQPKSGGSTDGTFFHLIDNSPVLLPAFNTNPGQLTFRFVQGDTTLPSAQTVTVSGTAQGLTASPVEPWLRVTPSGAAFAISVNPAGLAPGIYRGTVRLAPPSGVVGSVSVTLNILAAAPLFSAVEPSRVPIGSDDTEITLRGAGFSKLTTIQVDTLPWLLSPVRLIDSATLRFTLPKGYFSAEYNFSITLQNPDSAISKPLSLAVGKPAPAISAGGIVSAASFAGGVISPGEIVTIFGENFAPGMVVNFGGIKVTPLYITPTQLSVTVPPTLAGASETVVTIEASIEYRSIPTRILVWPARPGLFTADSSGKGFAAALNQDGSVNSPANPAAKGSIVVLYGTGGGVESLPAKVFIDGMECEVLYAGAAPGLVAGTWQLNVRVPDYASKGGVVWRAGDRESPVGVFIALRD